MGYILKVHPHDHHSILRIAIREGEGKEKVTKEDTMQIENTVNSDNVGGGGGNVVESDYKIIHRMLKDVCERGSAMMSKLVGEPTVPLQQYRK